MMELILYLITLLASLTVVQTAGANGALNGTLQRGFTGVSTQVVSSNFLLSYTNVESFLRACAQGQIGIFGYLFLGSIALLIIVWVNNLIEYETAII